MPFLLIQNRFRLRTNIEKIVLFINACVERFFVGSEYYWGMATRRIRKQNDKLDALGLKLKAIRLSKGLTLKELGFKIDKEPQSISRLETGSINPTYLFLVAICEGLEIEINQLFEK
jgi:putative transcriptional regulator